jgi:hypothetical protein
MVVHADKVNKRVYTGGQEYSEHVKIFDSTLSN